MNITEIFAKQIEGGATKMFFYGIETVRENEDAIEIRSHRDSLDTFPKLTYVRHMSDAIPLFQNE